jgi:hypothetical protein
VIEVNLFSYDFPLHPVWVTEASNNKAGITAAEKAEEYAKFCDALRHNKNVKGITFFVASASNTDWSWTGGSCETWDDVGMATRVRAALNKISIA